MKEIMMEMGQGKSSFNLGAGFELACMHGQLDIKFINGLKERPTFNPLSFAREYQSEWTGTSDNSLVQLDDLLEARVIKKAEHKASGEKDVEYVLAYDVSRAKVIWRVSRKLLISRVGKFGES